MINHDKVTSMMPLLLAQSYQDAWDDYKRALNNPSFICWDYIILTASNEQQAESFRAYISVRKQAGTLPDRTKFVVLADPDGKRVGSGGATLGVIRYIAEETGRADFEGLRILVIHSGGDSKRIPQYSALGKLFSPVPRELPDGRASTLFDELLIMMSSVPQRVREGILLLSGDVLLLFNPLQIDFSGEGAAAISFKEKVQTGQRHGVFLRDDDGNVRRFLHKQEASVLEACGAVNEYGCVDIDTGAVIFSPEIMSALFGLISSNGSISEEKYLKYVNDNVRLSLYGDFLYPLANESTLDRFYLEKPENGYSEDLRDARKAVWNALRPFRMRLLRMAPAKFLHFGTTQEVMSLMSDGVTEYSYLGWKKWVNSSIHDENASGYCSVLSTGAKCGHGSYLETSYVHHGAVIGENTIISHLDIQDETIPPNIVLHGLKQRDGRFVVRIYGKEDNAKDSLESGCTFLGHPLSGFILNNDIQKDELWIGDSHTLWEAVLYPACNTVAEALAAALNIYDMACGKGDVNEWRSQERVSLKSGFNNADPHALVAWNKRMMDIVQMDRLNKMIHNGVPASQAEGMLSAKQLTPIQDEWLNERIGQIGLSERMRLHYYIGRALDGTGREKHIGECFRCLQKDITENTLIDLEVNESLRIMCDSYTVKFPLRVNWGGGWSDTPPYCNENGGTVLNAAIKLNGELPVTVTLTKLDEYKIVVDSRDMDAHGEFSEIGQLQKTGDPYDKFVLQKAALVTCGIIPAANGNLREVLERLGSGFRMQTEVTGVPKGSGLGTSSILAAACVKCLLSFVGVNYGEDDLYSRVLCMEQIMSTGGGWQDQVGGISNGIKYTTSKPGIMQELKVEHLKLPDDIMSELNERFVLVYTGQRRLARNLLRDVVGRYIGNEPDSLFALNEIQRIAAMMKFELERGRVDDFAELLTRHWDLSQKVDVGSTNTLIDQIFSVIDDLIDGRMICGAGGGGFLQAVLKKGISKADVDNRLKSVFQDSSIGVWDCQLI